MSVGPLEAVKIATTGQQWEIVWPEVWLEIIDL
jgi:hypothetical protein